MLLAITLIASMTAPPAPTSRAWRSQSHVSVTHRSAQEPATPSSPPSAEEPSIDLMRQRERLTRAHRPLGIATWASLLVTEVAGTILAVNQRTVFGPGSCNLPTTDGSNPCVLGDFGSGRGPLNAFHELSAFITLGFYASTGLYGLAMPDPEHATVGSDDRASRLRWHRRFAYIHLAGMILLPILGVLSVEPGLVGLHVDTTSSATIMQSRARIDDYQADLRTIHLGVGYVTFAALTLAMLYEIAF